MIECQAPLSMEFSRQEYWSGLLVPTPGDLPDSGIETASLVCPALQVDSLPAEPSGKHFRETSLSGKHNRETVKQQLVVYDGV